MSHSDHASLLSNTKDRGPREPRWPWITLGSSTMVLVALILLGQPWLNAGVTLTPDAVLCTGIDFARSPRRDFAWQALAVVEVCWLVLGLTVVTWRLVRGSQASVAATVIGLLPLVLAYSLWGDWLARILSGVPTDSNFDTAQGAILMTVATGLYLAVPAVLPTVTLALASWSRIFRRPLRRGGFSIGFLWTQASLSFCLFILTVVLMPLSDCID